MFRAIAFVAAAVCHASALWAGNLTPSDNEFCDWQFSGVVEKGDAEQLSRIPSLFGSGGLVLCLDSPGGSLLEGQAMFTTIWQRAIYTRVLPGHRCESACAVAFLGGSADVGTDLIKFPDRTLWIGAKLGFHGPALDLPEDNSTYSAKSIESAFSLALKAAENFYEINKTTGHGHRAMTDHTYQSILSTQPSDMYFISTVGDVILSDTYIGGGSWPARPAEEMVLNICDNLFLSGAFPSREGNNSTYDQDFVSTTASLAALRQNRKRWFKVRFEQSSDGTINGFAGSYPMATKYEVPECFVSFRPDRLADHDEETPSSSGTISAFIRGSSSFEHTGAFDYNTWFSEAENEIASFWLPPWYAYPFNFPLDQLPVRADHARAAAAGGGYTEATAKPEDFVKISTRDLAGGDIGRSVVKTAEGCVNLCTAQQSCDAVTYDRWNRMCFLKSTSQSSHRLFLQGKSDSFVVSSRLGSLGVSETETVMKRREGKGFFDAPMATRSTENFEDCRMYCSGEPACVAINYRAADNACEFFDAPGEYFDREGYEMGLFYQPL